MYSCCAAGALLTSPHHAHGNGPPHPAKTTPVRNNFCVATAQRPCQARLLWLACECDPARTIPPCRWAAAAATRPMHTRIVTVNLYSASIQASWQFSAGQTWCSASMPRCIATNRGDACHVGRRRARAADAPGQAVDVAPTVCRRVRVFHVAAGERHDSDVCRRRPSGSSCGPG